MVGNIPAANYTLISTGSAISSATSTEAFQVDVTDFTLAPGATGLAIVSRIGGHTWYVGNAGIPSGSADIIITPQSSNTNFDTATTATSTNSWSGGFIGNPLNDLYPGFTADVTSGLSPLTVNFTDTSVTNDPIGVLSWAWDFENDGLVDDTTRTPRSPTPAAVTSTSA